MISFRVPTELPESSDSFGDFRSLGDGEDPASDPPGSGVRLGADLAVSAGLGRMVGIVEPGDAVSDTEPVPLSVSRKLTAASWWPDFRVPSQNAARSANTKTTIRRTRILAAVVAFNPTTVTSECLKVEVGEALFLQRTNSRQLAADDAR